MVASVMALALGSASCVGTPSSSQVNDLPIHVLLWMKRKAPPPAIVVDAFVEVSNRGTRPLTDCEIAVGGYKKRFERLEPGETLTVPAQEFVNNRKRRLLPANISLLKAAPSECTEGSSPAAQFVVESSPRPYSNPERPGRGGAN
jgi:hypothetical protein